MGNTKEGGMIVAAKLKGFDPVFYLSQLALGLKHCNKCKEWKDLSEYSNDKHRHDGKKSNCFLCNRVKVKRTTKGRVSTFKGHTHTEETKQKLSEAMKGKQIRLGIKHTDESRAKMSKTMRLTFPKGESSRLYKHGLTAMHRGIRFSTEYKRWRYDVFVRDKFTCQHCGDNKGGNLCAHHILSFADHPDKRLELSNGLTLCTACHKIVHGQA